MSELNAPPTIYEYGAMSSRYSLQADSKYAAYAAMVVHYNQSAHLIAIYAPEESKSDSWLTFDGKISDRLDEIFHEVGGFDKYVSENKEAVLKAHDTIKRIV